MIELIIFLVLLTLGFVVGSILESRHYRSIRIREKQHAQMHVLMGRKAPENAFGGRLVMGSVVVSVDYFKQFAAGLRNLFGGRVRTYESLLDRARREAILRMKEDAKKQGFDSIINVKIETSSISKGANNQFGTVEVVAYGSAMRFTPITQA